VESSASHSITTTPPSAEPAIFASWEMFICPSEGDMHVSLVVLGVVLFNTGFKKAHVCKSRGHDVDMHGMASAFGI
jgi:hypothetical protein